MTEPTKLSINTDAFIYAINQAFEARSKANGDFNSHLRYEPFLTKTWILPKTLDFNSFKSLLLEIISHHFKVLPNFQRNEAVDIENISWFSHSIATLFADLDYLLLSFTGNKLPSLPGNSIPKAVSSKNIILAIQKYSDYLNNKSEENMNEPFSLLPLKSETNESLDHTYVQEVWSLIASFTKKTFGSYFELVQAYVLWKYSTKETQEEVIDWNVRPPCGAAYHKQFKEMFDREREERFAKRNERNKKNHSDNQKNDFKSGDKKHSQPKYKHKSEENIAPIHKEKHHKDENKPAPKSSHFTQNISSIDQKQQQNIEEALDEARKAIQKLMKNNNANEIHLAPQNSFVRREQHSLITEAGFDTESLGEAKSRHVCVKRKA
ncbi:R3H domain-containing nucleic acid-binding protein [Silvanigrella aquatica]|uniref:R3H domain-containing protein n=1 Tax=Silvanigrella aquatica TaxID=1915309 RepID=A0A1L4D2S0_9BACT|nr:R3H domain-containing nucleic acid-binding protein [Silvanigrella aquatica]APJ04487.1 hypothetical protein AXG55_11430 [Silvanigrella aquatica]